MTLAQPYGSANSSVLTRRRGAQLRMLKAQILEFDRRILAWHRSNETSRRLDAIPGIGPALATALVASVADPNAFRSGPRSSHGAIERGLPRPQVTS